MAEKETFGRFLGLKIEVFDNRVEVREGILFRKKQTFPYSNITSVSVTPFTKRLVIETNDGDNYKYRLGWLTGRKANRAREAIAARM